MKFFFYLVLAVAFYALYIYNKLVRQKNLLAEAWSGIDVQLKRRHDLIPNLVTIVKSYAKHEQDTLEDVVRLRNESQSTSDIGAKSGIENSISGDLKKIFALVESYPDLKADTNFRSLQETLIEVEDNLQYARRYYNGTVRDYNSLIETFPSNLIANRFAHKTAKFFEIEYATERNVPEISF